MGTAHAPALVLPLAGVISHLDWPADLEASVVHLLGPVILRSPRCPFCASRYYEDEMGTDLVREFLAFPPRDPAGLVSWKTGANQIEDRTREQGRRRVNLDPGYLTLGGLFLASTKPGPHRLYLADGIYGEITLRYVAAAWQPLPWTFPDFRAGSYDHFLTTCREYLKRFLRRPAKLPDDRPIG